MRFRRLSLRNWRSFLGQHDVEFAASTDRNVTIFVGQNGTGKTALLNAFTWALFGETTAGFRQSEDLFNHAALEAVSSDAPDRLEVRLDFEHDGDEFSVARVIDASRPAGASAPVVSAPRLVATRRRKGSTEAVEQEDINVILPPGLHPFFFFPAENIGKDIDHTDAAAIRASMESAIDVLLGIERYDNALRVISTALGRHLKAPRGATQNVSLDAAEAEMKKAREDWEQRGDKKKSLPGDIKRLEVAVEFLRAQLDANVAAKREMEAFHEVKAQLAAADKQATDARDAQREVVNRYCCVLFGHEFLTDAAKILEDAHRNGEIPPRVSAGLLNELLDERHKCICGQQIGPTERTALETLRSRTVEDNVAIVASDLRGRLPQLVSEAAGRRDQAAARQFLDEVRKASEADALYRKLHNRQQEMLNLQPDLLSQGDPEETMRAWREQTKRLLQLRADMEELTAFMPQAEKRKSEAEREYQRQLNRSSEAGTIGKARELLSNVEATLTKIQEAVRSSARQDVERNMNQFYEPLLMKSYRIRLKPDFRYEIHDTLSGRTLGASSSETALATFAFVGALASLMPVYASLEEILPRGDDKSVGGLTGDISRAYPVVLDAPFSPFGADYSERFSQKLPDLLPQSIVIVREDQLRYVVPMLNSKRVGAAYVLRLHSGKEAGKRFSWLQHDVDYVVNTANERPSHTELVRLPME